MKDEWSCAMPIPGGQYVIGIGIQLMPMLYVTNLDTNQLVCFSNVYNSNTLIIFIGATVFRRSYFGQGMGPVFFRSLSCRGTEASILQCPRSFNSYYSSCSHSRDAGVRCEGIIITIEVQGNS